MERKRGGEKGIDETMEGGKRRRIGQPRNSGEDKKR